MTNEELNTALYKKVFAEQEKYREWLLSQPPDEILNHCYEYTVREDIVLALEEYDLSDKQCKALLKLPSPLADVFKEYAVICGKCTDRQRPYIFQRHCRVVGFGGAPKPLFRIDLVPPRRVCINNAVFLHSFLLSGK